MCSTHMDDIAVTLEVSHSEMSSLKLVAWRNLPGCGSALEHWHVPHGHQRKVQHSHAVHPRHARSVPLRDVLVEACGQVKPARLRLSTRALARPRIGTTHMPCTVVTLEMSHPEMFWLKLVVAFILPGCVSALEHARFEMGTHPGSAWRSAALTCGPWPSRSTCPTPRCPG